MALHPSFPSSPCVALDPAQRWFPADEALRESAYEKLLPPLVAQIRTEVKAWRDTGYAGASATAQTLLSWWFDGDHVIEQREPTLDDDNLRDDLFEGRPVSLDEPQVLRSLSDSADVQAFAKNYLAFGFRIYYVKTDGDFSTYTPDFSFKDARGGVWVIETKGREELDLPRKMARLAQWCEDATAASAADGGSAYRFIYVDQEGFERHPPATLTKLAISARVAAASGRKGDYIRTRRQDDAHYKHLILDYLKQFGEASRGDLRDMLLPTLPGALSAEKKENKFKNLLAKLRQDGQIVRHGEYARWRLG